HRAISGHGAGLRLYAIASDHPGDVHRHRRRDERALSAFERATRLVAIFAEARPVDAASETVHGLSAAGDVAVSALRARRPARLGRRNRGELFSAGDQWRVLDE